MKISRGRVSSRAPYYRTDFGKLRQTISLDFHYTTYGISRLRSFSEDLCATPVNFARLSTKVRSLERKNNPHQSPQLISIVQTSSTPLFGSARVIVPKLHDKVVY